MKKRIISLILVLTLITGALILPTNAKTVDAEKISIQDARNIATYYLTTMSVPKTSDFDLLSMTPLYNLNDEEDFYCFEFYENDSNESGYIVISLKSDLPYVMEQGKGENPYSGKNVVKTYYISPMSYFNEMNDGSIIDQNGETVSREDVVCSFNEYNAYRDELKTNKSSIISEVTDENSSLIKTIDKVKLTGLLKNLSKENIKLFFDELFDYWIGSKWRSNDFDEVNEALEQIVKDNAGSGYYISESSVVDKEYMVPKRQSYFETDVGNGICGKASFMMMMSYYRDSGVCPSLPADDVMYAEISKIFMDINEYFSIFFSNEFVNNNLGIVSSFEILGTLDMGIAYYLYSKGYKEQAQNVIDNMRFSVTMVPDSVSDFLLTLIRTIFNGWFSQKTKGELTLKTQTKMTAADVIRKSLKKKEPAIIGCLASIGCDMYSNHYFAAVGYYNAKADVKFAGMVVDTKDIEYVEVYDTWGSYSAIINFTVLKSTSLYSANSLAKLS